MEFKKKIRNRRMEGMMERGKKEKRKEGREGRKGRSKTYINQ